MNEVSFSVSADFSGERLDKIISAQIDELSRSAVQKIIDDGGVTVNGRIVMKSMKLKEGDVIVQITC